MILIWLLVMGSQLSYLKLDFHILGFSFENKPFFAAYIALLIIFNPKSGLRFLLLGLLRLLQVRNESKRNPIYGSRFYSAYEKYYKNNRNTK